MAGPAHNKFAGRGGRGRGSGGYRGRGRGGGRGGHTGKATVELKTEAEGTKGEDRLEDAKVSRHEEGSTAPVGAQRAGGGLRLTAERVACRCGMSSTRS